MVTAAQNRSPAARKPGRPSKAALAERAAEAMANEAAIAETVAAPLRRNRPDPRAAVREPVREDTRSMPRRDGQVLGRNGEVLTRSRKNSVDPFEITPDMIPRGWSYQWNVVTTFNASESDRQRIMAENGWRPVPIDRYPGRFAPVGTVGEIVRDGLRLEERPIELTKWAHQEAIDEAQKRVSDQNEKLGLAMKAKVATPGFDAGNVRGTGVRSLGVQHAPEPEAGHAGYKYED